MGGGSFGIQNCDLEMWGKAKNYTYNSQKFRQCACHNLLTYKLT